MSSWIFKRYSVKDVKFAGDRTSGDDLQGLVEFTGCRGEKLYICFLTAELVKVVVIPPKVHYLVPSFICCGPQSTTSTHFNFDGVDRLNIHNLGFSLPTVKLEHGEGKVKIASKSVIVEVNLSGELCLKWYKSSSGEIVAEDSTIGAYQYEEVAMGVQSTAEFSDLSPLAGKISHFMQLESRNNERIYGLGEVAGGINHYGKRITFTCSDSMGYDACSSSYSMYKHFPFFISHSSLNNRCYAMFYDDLSRCEFDFGNFISAFQGRRRFFATESNFLDFYMIFGNSVGELLDSLGSNLVGRPRIPPKWALGYLASSMVYTDAENAQEQLENFPTECKIKNQMPCSGFFLSSGYSLNDSFERHVFVWNRRRLPDPKNISNIFHKFALRFVPNLKPWLLTTNPKFHAANEEKIFLESGDAETTYFWKGRAGSYAQGKYIDFGNVKGRRFWKDGIDTALVGFGFGDAIWNDNNEYEVDGSFTMKVGSKSLPISLVGRPVQSLLMAQTSLQVLQGKEGGLNKRELVVSRSGCLGIHRFASQTWSGDNSTTWETMKFNIPMSLSLGLSLWVGNGFDVGGFFGEKVSLPLFVRWVSLGVWFAGRFTIHSSSWKGSSSVNSPWMYEEATEYIRGLLQLRHQLLPQIFSLYIEAFLFCRPLTRPLMFHYSSQRALDESFEFLVGENLLVAPSLKEAGNEAVYFPGVGEFWADIETGKWYAGETTCEVCQDLFARRFGVPVFLRNNAGFVSAGDIFSPQFKDGENLEENRRNIYLANKYTPGKINDFEFAWLEGDGELEVNEFVKVVVSVKCTEEEVLIEDINTFSVRIQNSKVVTGRVLTGYELKLTFNLVHGEKRSIRVGDKSKKYVRCIEEV